MSNWGLNLSAREILGMQKSNEIVGVGGGVGYQSSIEIELTLHDIVPMHRFANGRVLTRYADLRRARRSTRAVLSLRNQFRHCNSETRIEVRNAPNKRRVF